MSGCDDGLRRAAAYIAAHGDALAQVRANALIGDACAAAQLVARLDAIPVDSVEALRDLLGICDDHRLLRVPVAERACASAAQWQRADGSFRGTPKGGAEEAVYETGMLGGYLAKTRAARLDALQAAGDFLASHWSPELVQGGDWKPIAACSHYFANAGHERSDEILQWCGRELERGFRTGRFDAVRTARVLVYCDAHALPGAQLTSGELIASLSAEQRADGGFGEPGPSRVVQTLDAIVALRHLGVAVSAPEAHGGQARTGR
jgi:hypothetical protein